MSSSATEICGCPRTLHDGQFLTMAPGKAASCLPVSEPSGSCRAGLLPDVVPQIELLCVCGQPENS